MKKISLNQRGFSLIELMVVVAVIGILAVIAIPNYQRFQRTARQTEAKTQMGGIYTAIQTFISQHGVGTPNLPQMGYQVSGSIIYDVGWAGADKVAAGVLNPNLTTRPAGYTGPAAGDVDHVSTFEIGTKAAGADKDVAGNALTLNTFQASTPASCTRGSGATANQATCNQSQNTCGTTACGPGTWVPAVTTRSGSVEVNNRGPGRATFTIGARGNIGGTDEDEWRMTESKALIHDTDGVQ